VCGLYFSHPASRYFAVGQLGRDQVADYQLRKGMPLQEIEKWLRPYLNYEPARTSESGQGCGCGREH
jgi:5-methyltetrahydrofolate--homocysteine methyltransferase